MSDKMGFDVRVAVDSIREVEDADILDALRRYAALPWHKRLRLRFGLGWGLKYGLVGLWRHIWFRWVRWKDKGKASRRLPMKFVSQPTVYLIKGPKAGKSIFEEPDG